MRAQAVRLFLTHPRAAFSQATTKQTRHINRQISQTMNDGTGLERVQKWPPKLVLKLHTKKMVPQMASLTNTSKCVLTTWNLATGSPSETSTKKLCTAANMCFYNQQQPILSLPRKWISRHELAPDGLTRRLANITSYWNLNATAVDQPSIYGVNSFATSVVTVPDAQIHHACSGNLCSPYNSDPIGHKHTPLRT